MKKEIQKKNKHFLNRYRKIREHIKVLSERLYELRQKIENVSAVTISDMPKGNGNGLTKEDLLIKKIELENRIVNLNNKATEIRKDILSKIDLLEDVRHAQILEMYFIDLMTLEEIAEELKYSYRYTINLYSDAITLLQCD